MAVNPINLSTNSTLLFDYARAVTGGSIENGVVSGGIIGDAIFVLVYAVFLIWSLRSDNRLGIAYITIIMGVFGLLMVSMNLITWYLAGASLFFTLIGIIAVFFGQ